MDGSAVGQFDLFYPATGAVSVGGFVLVLMVFGDLAESVIGPVQLAVGAAGVGDVPGVIVLEVDATAIRLKEKAKRWNWPLRVLTGQILSPAG